MVIKLMHFYLEQVYCWSVQENGAPLLFWTPFWISFWGPGGKSRLDREGGAHFCTSPQAN